MELLIDSHHGIYIPQEFARGFDAREWGVSASDAEILLAGPDHESYWDVWDDVLQNAEYIDEDGAKWRLFEDGDLFAVRENEGIDEF